MYVLAKKIGPNALFPKKSEKVIGMDQKWTKRKNERPPESTDMDLRRFRIQADDASTSRDIVAFILKGRK